MYPMSLFFSKMPAHLNTAHTRDDAFIYRFKAAGYLVKIDRTYLCFDSVSARHDFGEWVKHQAASYWKQNGLSIRALAPGMVVQYGWRFRDFSPEWRRRNGYVFNAAVSEPIVGELGFGPSFPIAPYELGLFNFEYKQQGREAPPPSFLPPRLATGNASVRAPSVSLASRLNTVDSTTRSPAPSETASHVNRAPTPAYVNGTLDAADEAEDVKPSAEVLRRAEELANAIRAQSASLPVAPSPVFADAQPLSPSPADAHRAVAPAVTAHAPSTAASAAGPAPSISSMSACTAEQPAPTNRRRRLTAMELTDFERELDDFTSSAADAVMGSASPPAATRSEAAPVNGAAMSSPPSAPTGSGSTETRAAQATSSAEQSQTLAIRSGGSLPGDYQPLTPVSLAAPFSAPASIAHSNTDPVPDATSRDIASTDDLAATPTVPAVPAKPLPPVTAKVGAAIPGLPVRPSFVDPPPFDYRM